jgi:hypothetical protein
MVVVNGYPWTALPGLDVEIRVVQAAPFAIRYHPAEQPQDPRAQDR